MNRDSKDYENWLDSFSNGGIQRLTPRELKELDYLLTAPPSKAEILSRLSLADRRALLAAVRDHNQQRGVTDPTKPVVVASLDLPADVRRRVEAADRPTPGRR
jgi:hypothetical protein